MPPTSRCPKCDELHVATGIRSPAELSRAMRIVRANLADGTIQQVVVPTDDRPHATPFFLSLGDSGPWPDFVNFQFACTMCGSRFELVAETYHGSGGHWQPI